jgi:hypothetical protein
MKRSYLLLGVVVALGLTILSGVVQGRMRHRWGRSPDTVRAAEKLAELPSQFGDWKLRFADDSAIGLREEAVSRGGDNQNDHFRALSYKANNRCGDMLRVCYAWSTGRHRSANRDPRMKYAGQPYLYKIQLSSPLPATADLQADDPCKKFPADFLPVARKCMIEPSDGN